MNWVKLKFCDKPECNSGDHIFIGKGKVCDHSCLPYEVGEYLVSTGSKIGTAYFQISFENYNPETRCILNDDIKYWASLEDVELPEGD